MLVSGYVYSINDEDHNSILEKVFEMTNILLDIFSPIRILPHSMKIVGALIRTSTYKLDIEKKIEILKVLMKFHTMYYH